MHITQLYLLSKKNQSEKNHNPKFYVALKSKAIF